MHVVRVAWFSPLPPARSGIAAYSAEILPLLTSHHRIDAFVDTPEGRTGAAGVSAAHEFAWRHRLDPYDLIVYQLGNARCHDYMWAYLAHYPGLVVLHDARLHHARARQLPRQRRIRREIQIARRAAASATRTSWFMKKIVAVGSDKTVRSLPYISARCTRIVRTIRWLLELSPSRNAALQRETDGMSVAD